MKILVVANNRHFDYKKLPIGMVALPHFFKVRGHEVKCLGRDDFLKVYSAYKEFGPDIVFSSWIPGGFVAAFLRKFRLIKCPVIHAWDDYYEEMMMNYPHILIGFMEGFTIKNSDYITTPTGYNAIRAKKMGKKFFYVPQGYTGGSKKSKINLKKIKTKKENLILVYLGDQEKFKRVDKIVRGVADQDCDLFLLGDINPELQKIGGKNVHFLGRVDSEEVYSLLKQADILVNSADTDANFKFFDYMRAKKPILAYDGRPRTLLERYRNTYFTKDFKEGVAKMINDKGLRERLEKNAKKVRVYSWEEVTDMYLDAFRKVLKKRD
ncbi:MAG: glycosyltransferase [archaeon]